MTSLDFTTPLTARHFPVSAGTEVVRGWKAVPPADGDRDTALPWTAGGDGVRFDHRNAPCTDCDLAFDRHLHLHLRPDPAEVGGIRRAVRTALAAWGCPPSAVDDTVLLTGELVGNAVTHGPDELITVNLLHVGNRLLLEVTDGSPARPAVRQAHPDDERGRGMCLVQVIASAWGARRDSYRRKTTWCTLALDGNSAPPPSR
ncbi:ATP-binding protein [Streptomyces sp. 8N706]|uniref:ATP-binding protein n=1 Tax=Streptomyces sp. 8N706 TaxID=3457416 RepID=UPI003FD196B9